MRHDEWTLSDEQQQPMTSARLAHIRDIAKRRLAAASAEAKDTNGESGEESPAFLAPYLISVLNEVERQGAELDAHEAREAALVAFARNIASDHEHKWRYEDCCKRCGIDFSEWSADMQRQARALLASAGEAEAGSPQEQAAQGEA